MKKFLKGFIALSLGLAMVGCAKEYDDTALKSKVDELSQDVNTLKAQQKAMQAVIDVWKAGGYIASIDDSVPGQHTITFYGDNGKVVVLYDGEDGEQGPAGEDGDAYFKSIVTDENGVTFTLNDEEGTSFTIPFAKAFKLVINNLEAEVEAGKAVEFPYEIQNANATTTVDVFAGGNYVAAVNATESKIVVTPPTPAVNGSVLAWAQNEEGLFSMKKLSFIVKANTEVKTTQEELEAIPSEANEFVVNVVSNIDIDVEKPTVDWVSVVVTKADYKLTLTLAENTTGAPRETEIIVVRKDNGAQVQKIKIVQLYSEPEPDPVVYYVFDGAAGKHGISTKESTYQPYAWTASNAMETVPAGYPEKADWKVTLGNVQNNGSGDFWFGANSGNKDKLTFGNSGYAEAEAIAAALDVKTDAKHYGALICTSNLPTISKIEITSTADMGGGQATTMWVVKSTDNGTTYSVVKKIDSPAKAANTLFTIKIAKADRSASASYALVFYREGGQFQYKAPKITFYSADPTTVEKEVTIERLWGYYPNSGWPTSFVPANADRGVATDGENVYVTNTTDGTVVGIKITDQSKVTVNMTGVDGGFFKTCSAKTIYNPSTGKYILLVGSLANESDCNFNVYAWKDGIDQAPTKIISWNTNNGSPRRIGDFFTVSGDWSNGEIWARINQADPAAATTFVWKITDGVAGGVLGGGIGYAGSAGMGSVYKYSLDAPQVMVVTPTIAKFYTCKVESTWINANSDGIEWTDGSDVSAYAKRFGYTPFEFNGKKYIAYLHMVNAARGWLTVLNDTQGTAEGFMKTIIDNDIFFQGAVQINKDEDSTDVVDGATYSGNTMANCSVAVLKDEVIIVGHQQNTGLAVFKMYLK